ncbi:MAG: 4Fe-4S dicluster domain-containing protein [Dehalococcoidia bacterium]
MIQISWDDKKCALPQDCRKCLDTCPQGVFMIYPRDGRKPGKATDNWAIAPLFISLCTGCNICEETCPEGAIAVSVAR